MAVLMILSLLALQGQLAVADGGDGTISLAPGGLGGSSPTTPPVVAPDPDESAPAPDGPADGKASSRPGARESAAGPSSDATINVLPGPPRVEITKSTDAPAGGVNPGDSFSFTITVSNVSDFFLRDVVIDDTVPAGLTINSVSGPNCSINGQAVSCAVGFMDPQTSVTVTINVIATADACPSVTNQASVTKAQGQDTQTTFSNQVTVDVSCTPDVHVSKSASTTSVAPDGSFSYTVTVSNDGNATANDVTMTDTIPAGLTIDGVTGADCSVVGQTVTCTLGSLEAGASVEITINVTATADACPSVTNQAQVSASNESGEDQEDNTSNQVTVSVNCEPGVHITKGASVESTVPGGSFSYGVTVSNNGDATAHNVVVTDTIPNGLTITSVSGPDCSVNGQTVTCNIGDLAPGASVTITINVTATEGACPSVTNQATVTFDQGEGSASVGSNRATVDVICDEPEPDVEISKSASSVSVQPGDSFSYTITVSNNGDATAHNVVVTDTIPNGLTITSVSGPDCSVNGQTVTCNIGDLAPGASVTITINVTADEGACPSVTNQATVTFDQGSGSASVGSNPVTVGVNCEPDIGIVKNADAPGGGVIVGESFSYTITVTNNGTGTAHNVVITDIVPDGLTIDSVEGPNCSVDGQTVTCVIGDLGPGESVTITINVTATEDACESVTNTATVTYDEGSGSAESNPVTVIVDCVEGEVVTPTPTPTVGGVAFTGTGSAGLGLLALALLVLGSGLLYLGRQRLGDSDA